jgi:antibiotic biosynthesis monooxygenase (ABM) superfamily enzyme
MSRQEGSMGTEIIRPIDNKESKPEYVIIFRFNNSDNLTKWEKSAIRNEWLRKGRELIVADPDVQKLTGFEFWFTPYSKKSLDLTPVISPPPRYKIVIVTIPLISLLPLTLVPQIHFVTEMLFIPYSIRFVIAITITVILMTYLIMPLLTELLRSWLFSN